MQKLTATFFLSVFLVAAGHGYAAPKQETLPVPPDVSPEIIADDMRYNGAPMQILQFITFEPEEVLKYYRRYFEENAREGKYAEQGTNRRKTIGAMMEDKRTVNVEITTKGKQATHVYVSSMNIFEMKPPEELAKAFPRMPGTKVLQHQDSRDGNKENQFVVMENNQSVEGNAMYLREHFIGRNWQRDRDMTVETGTHRQLMFSKGNRQMQVDVQQRGPDTTFVIFNVMIEN
jgi:hypothetical protein